MNGIDKITSRIAADGNSEAQALLSRSRQQADAIYNGYQAAADHDYQQALAQGKKDAAERVERLGSVSQLEARKLQLTAKQEMLDKAFDLALRKLLSMPEEQYVSLLASLAVKGSDTGTESLIFSHTDRNRIGKKVVLLANETLSAQGRTGALKLSEESRPFQGGLYIQNGNVETNCTFAALVRLQRQTAAKEAADMLFD